MNRPTRFARAVGWGMLAAGAAVEEADRILFMVDGRDGLMPLDEKIADVLRRSRKEVFLGVNKADGPEHQHLTADFYSLGFDRVYPVSAAHGYGLADLLDAMTEDLGEPAKEELPDDVTKSQSWEDRTSANPP